LQWFARIAIIAAREEFFSPIEENVMRLCLLASLAGFFLMGCSQSSPPQAKRGNSQSAGNKQVTSFEESNNDTRFDDSGGEVRLEELTLTAPQGWGRKPPQSSFIQAEYMLSRAEGDNQDGRLTLSTSGGSMEANIDRWKGQFGGKPEKSNQEQMVVNGISVTVVDFSGDFDDQRGPFAPPVKRSDFRMIAAIIPVGPQLYFVKAVGPKKTMEIHAEEIKAFVQSVKK
jgi:hypothetical protein